MRANREQLRKGPDRAYPDALAGPVPAAFTIFPAVRLRMPTGGRRKATPLLTRRCCCADGQNWDPSVKVADGVFPGVGADGPQSVNGPPTGPMLMLATCAARRTPGSPGDAPARSGRRNSREHTTAGGGLRPGLHLADNSNPGKLGMPTAFSPFIRLRRASLAPTPVFRCCEWSWVTAPAALSPDLLCPSGSR